MTLAPSKPSRFRRSSERNLADKQALTEEGRLRGVEAEQLKRAEAFERLSYGLPEVMTGLVEREKCERDWDLMAAHDLHTYDRDGVVR
jgi:hypothetical protein